MVQPFDYSIRSTAQGPLQALSQGMQLGQQFAQIAEQREAQRLAQEQARAQAEQQLRMDAALKNLNAKRSAGTATYDDFQNVVLANPGMKSLAENMTGLFNQFSTERQNNEKSYFGKVIASLQVDPSVAVQLLNQRADATAESNPNESMVMRTYARLANENPGRVADTLIAMNSGPFGKDWTESVLKVRQATVMRPTELREASAKAEKAIADAKIAQAQAGTAEAREAASRDLAVAQARKAQIEAQVAEAEQKAGFAAKEPAAKGPFVVGGALVSAEGVPLYQSPETAAKPIVVGNALVSPTGQVLYKAEAGEPNPVVVGSRVVNPRTGQVIFDAPPEDRPIIVGRDVVTRDGRLIYRAPADQPAPMTVGGNIVDPSTGRVIYASPEAAQKPIVLSPGQSVFDPETNKPIFTAQRDANTGVVGNKLIDMQTGRVIQEFPAEPGRAYVVGGNLVAPSGEVLFRAEDERVRPVVVDGKVVNAANGNVIYSAPEGKRPMVVNGNIVDANTGEVLYRSPTDGGQESVISRTLRDLGLEPTLENARKYHQAIRAPEAMTALQKAQAYRQTLIANGQRGSEEFKENERYIDNLLVDPGKLTEAQIQANALAERRIALLERQADPTYRGQLAAAEAAGAATGRQQVERASAVGEINTVVSELERALEKGGLIDRATGSGVGALRDVAAGFFGQATPGAIAVGQLQPIADLVLKIIPRFEGPQSDKDTQSYREAAGKLADPTVPNEIRRAAAKEIVRVLKDRKGRLGSTVTIPMQPVGNAVPAAGAAPAAAPLTTPATQRPPVREMSNEEILQRLRAQ